MKFRLRAGLALCVSLLFSTASAFAQDKPNILVIWGDDIGWSNISAYNHGMMGYETPNIDRLVEDGVAFTHAFCQNSVCSPSRASFLTGRYPRTTRLRQNGTKIPDDEILVTKMMADSGYVCGLAGKLHLAPCDGTEQLSVEAKEKLKKNLQNSARFECEFSSYNSLEADRCNLQIVIFARLSEATRPMYACQKATWPRLLVIRQRIIT